MMTDLRQLKCGACGNALFLMYESDDHNTLVAECSTCKSTTIIQPTMPNLKRRFGEKSEGVLCDMGD